MLEVITHKTFSQDPNARILAEYLRRNFPGGTYLSAYEAGFCGFSVHRALLNVGINNIVVNQAGIPVTDKEKRQKEDKRDSRKIARGLRNSELVAIHVPSVETEELRFFLKDRISLTKDLTRMKNRIKSYLNLFGIEAPSQFKETSRHFSMRNINWLRDIQLATHQGNLAIGCNNQSEVNAGCLDVGLESISSDNIYNFYPNPATNKISIETKSKLQGIITIRIFNMNGALLQQEKFQSQNRIEMDVSSMAKGIYLVKIQTEKEIESKKLVVQ